MLDDSGAPGFVFASRGTKRIGLARKRMLAGLGMSSREAVSEHAGIQPHDCVNAWSVSAAARCSGAVWTRECKFGGCAVGWR